jgi:signal transduction histidine kinase
MQYSLLNIQNADRIKYFIDKGLKEIIAPWHYQLMIYSDKLNAYNIYLSNNPENNDYLSPEIYQLIEKAFKTDNIVTEILQKTHYMIVPLQMKSNKIGFMVIRDRDELSFTKLEVTLIKSIRQQITALIIRMQDYSEITQRMHKMNSLMSITHALLKVIDVKTLEHDVVSACIDFTTSSRGFLIKRDSNGNYLYQVAMDYNKTPLSNISIICKTALSECQITKAPVITYNAIEDNRFKNSISVQDYKLHAIFCAPLIVDDKIYGYLYLDNFLDNSKAMYLNAEITTLLLDQIVIALKNALQYESIIHKSYELQSLDALKDEFMAIVSHELNTPLTTLQGYVSRLKRNLIADEEERQDIIAKIEGNVKKLIVTTNDIITMNTYNLKTTLPKASLQIEEILNLILHEIEILSRKRRMFIKLEVEKDMQPIEANWEALHMMIYNIVLNAIRFTNDFGTIVIGARKSAFQQEKIADKESLVIYIQDNGIGIPEHQIKNVFRKFYELNEIYAHKSGSIEYRSSGLGLGLATSRRIAELHGGSIWIKSKENEGTTVFINLPFK